jgi:hypothetical protein
VYFSTGYLLKQSHNVDFPTHPDLFITRGMQCKERNTLHCSGSSAHRARGWLNAGPHFRWKEREELTSIKGRMAVIQASSEHTKQERSHY